VKVFGQPVKNSLRRIGYMPQRESVDWDFPVNVMDVVLMGRYGRLGLMKRPAREDRDVARDCLDKVHMLPFANRQISNLSGGQQQRVFLARALAQESEIYLMDEPFAGVDAATESAIVKLLQELREAGKTVLVVNHDLQTAGERQDCGGCASRSSNRAGIFRHVDAAQHAADRFWADQRSLPARPAAKGLWRTPDNTF
jgi:manganese/zinc/iron transport system ATP- binding protein